MCTKKGVFNSENCVLPMKNGDLVNNDRDLL